MKVLIACEESQRVCIEFRKNGHEAYSCDIYKCSGGHPEWHINDDVIPLINGNCTFLTSDGNIHRINGKWDLIIAHPPCTYLANSGNRWFNINKYGDKAIQRIIERKKAADFFLEFINADCDHICVENPVGYMNNIFRKPDCIYNPYDFDGETESKRTCLWLKNLEPLKPTRIKPLNKNEITYNGYISKFNNKFIAWNTELCKVLRSKTPLGVAKAMANQWNNL